MISFSSTGRTKKSTSISKEENEPRYELRISSFHSRCVTPDSV
jgi:hypothetical protein